MAHPTAISRYQIRDRLGHGGMGVLYLALDPAIDRLVAVKLLRVNNPEIRERFIREAQIAARLQHPHIVTVYDVGTHEGQPFIAMEYIAGETLGELIHRKAPLPVSRRIELMADVCEGLAYAHKRGVVHRDVKPANLMVSRESGNVKILDFGIARTAGSNLTQVGMVMGTPNYMSPEQIAGQAVDHRSDIFAVGAVLYELLAHRQAFGGETPHAVLHQITSVEPTRVTALNPDLDPELDRILERAMAKTPDARYADLLVMRADLLRINQRIEADQESNTLVGDAGEPAGRVTPTPTPRGGRAGPDRARIAERRAARIATHLQSAEAALAAGALEEALAEVELGAEVEPDDPRIVRLHERVRAAIDARDAARLLQEVRTHLAGGALTMAGRKLGEASQLLPGSPDVQLLMRELDRAVEQRERLREQTRKAQEAIALAREYLEGGALDAALRASGEALGYRPEDGEAQQVRRAIRDAIDRRNQEAMSEARRDAARGHYDTAIRRLQAIRPADDVVSDLLAELEVARARAERERTAREEAAREQAAREQEERERLAREQAARELAERDRVRREELAREQTLREQAERARAFERLVTDARASLLGSAYDEAEDAVREARRLDPADAEAAELEREIAEARAEAERRDRERTLLFQASQASDEAFELAQSGDIDRALERLDQAPALPVIEETRTQVLEIRARRDEEARARETARREEEARAREAARREEEARAREAARRDEEARARESAQRAAQEAQDARREAARRAEAARALERKRDQQQARREAPQRGDAEDTVDTTWADDTAEGDAQAARSRRERRPDRSGARARTPTPSTPEPQPAAPLEVVPRPLATPVPGVASPRLALSAKQWIAAAAAAVLVLTLGGWLWSRGFGGVDEDARARTAVTEARARFDSGDQGGAVTMLEQYTPSHPTVQQTLDELRQRRTPRAPAETQKPPVQTPTETKPSDTTPPVTPRVDPPVDTRPATSPVAAIEAAAVQAQRAGDTAEALRQALLGLAQDPANQNLASIARGIVARAASEAATAQRRTAAIAGAADSATYRNAAQEVLRASLLPLARANEAVLGYQRAVQLFDRAATERQAAISADEARTRQLEEQRRQRADDVRTQTQEAQRLLREQKWSEALEVLKKVRALDPSAPGLDALVRQGEAGLAASLKPQPQPQRPQRGPDPAEAATAGVRQLLAAFKSGYESRDLPALRRIWPGMPASVETAYARLFRDNTALSWDYQVQGMTFASDFRSARVQCRVEVGQQGNRRSASEQRTYVLDVTSGGGSWTITNLTFGR